MNSVRRLTVAYFMVYAAVGSSAPLLSIYLETVLGASLVQISRILTTYAIIVMGANYLWGRYSDKIGRRKPLVVGGLFGMSAAFGLLAMAPSANFAWAVRVLEAVAMAAYSTTSLALIGDLLSKSSTRGRKMGSYRSFGSLSFALGAFGVSPIIDIFGIRPVYALGSTLFFVAALVALTVNENEEADEATAPLSSEPSTDATSETLTPPLTPSVDTSRLPAVFLVGVVLWSTAFGAAYSMWPNFLVSLGYPKSTANWLWGIAAVCEVPFMGLVGIIADGIGRMPVLVMGGMGMGLVILGYIFLSHVVWAWGTYLVPVGLIGTQVFRGFAYAASAATSMIYAAETGPNKTRAGMVGTYNMAMGLGQIVGLSIGGPIAQATSFETLFVVSTSIFFCSGLMFWFLRFQDN